MRHVVSFLRSPLGYIVNLLATVTQYTGWPRVLDGPLCAACEAFCARDGVQDSPLF